MSKVRVKHKVIKEYNYTPSKTLNITQDIIDKACPRDGAHCIVAMAVKAVDPEARNISVDTARIKFTSGDTKYMFNTPAKLQPIIIALDEDKKEVIKPIRIKLQNGYTCPKKEQVAKSYFNKPKSKRKKSKVSKVKRNDRRRERGMLMVG